MFTTTVTGEERVLSRLKFFDRDIWRSLQADVKEGGSLIAQGAKPLIPSQPATNWGSGGRLGWDAGSVQGSIKTSFRSRTRGGVTGVSARVGISNAAGNLWALAGSRTSTQFGDYMNSGWGTAYPRALTPSWRANIEKVRDKIQEAVDSAVRRASL